MNTQTASREAREHQLLLAAVRQMSRARLADHTLGAVFLTLLGALLYLAGFGLHAALAPELTIRDWASGPVAMSFTAGAAVAWLIALFGGMKAGLALSQATGTKGLAGLALLCALMLTAAPVIALMMAL